MPTEVPEKSVGLAWQLASFSASFSCSSKELLAKIFVRRQNRGTIYLLLVSFFLPNIYGTAVYGIVI
jgi:hypothetical protein